MNLDKIGIMFGTDKSSKKMNYLNFYEKYFESFKQKQITMMEIGVLGGTSLQTWEKYFTHPKSKFYGIDIDKQCERYKTKRTTIVIGNQEDPRFLQKLSLRVPCYDIIIDDGGHTMRQQQRTLGFLFRFVRPGGIFVVEDLITSHADYEPENYNKTKTKHTTLKMLENYNKKGVIKSDFITKLGCRYLQDHISSCAIERGSFSEIAFLIKK